MAVMADPLDTCPVTELEIGERGTDGSVEGASSRGLVCENLDGAAFHVLESHRISHACWTHCFKNRTGPAGPTGSTGNRELVRSG